MFRAVINQRLRPFSQATAQPAAGLAFAFVARFAGADRAVMKGLAGSDVDTIYATCCSNGRVLITLELDFSNSFRFLPEDTEGIIVVRPPRPILPAIRATLLGHFDLFLEPVLGF